MNQSNPLDLARTAFFEGNAHYEALRFPEAFESFTVALSHAPDRPSILLNLGVTMVRLHRFKDAIPILESALASEENSSDGWAALALAFSELALWPQCIPVCEKLFALGTEQLSIHLLYGRSLTSVGQIEEAKSAYRQALQLDSTCADAWYQLADLLREQGDISNAITSYQQALSLGAEPELVNYMLAAMNKSGEVLQPPRIYVQNLFDQYADDFEQHLVGQLGYCGHRVLIEQLPDACPSRFLSVLDLGCGTGLCAPLLRPKALHLSGIDLSTAMIEKSRGTGLYDDLFASDVHDYLSQANTHFDLVVAADVFIYVGELDKVFASLGKTMVNGGWLAFTVEPSVDGSNVQLLPSLRYGHSDAYIQALALRHNFVVHTQKVAPIRIHEGLPLMGHYWYLRHGISS
jgi:predicted TPR repeat methyltransferase